MRAEYRDLVLAYIEACPGRNAREIAEACGCSHDTAQRQARRLVETGRLISRMPVSRSHFLTYYPVNAVTEEEVGRRVASTREFLLEYVNNHPGCTTKEVAMACGCTHGAMRQIAARLVSDRELACRRDVGMNSANRYYPANEITLSPEFNPLKTLRPRIPVQAQHKDPRGIPKKAAEIYRGFARSF